MFLHAGNNFSLRSKDIIGIFDTDTSTENEITKNFLRRAEKEGRAEMVIEELPKSFIVTSDNSVYYAQVSVQTLIGRTDENRTENNGRN
ncbi:MAG: DUF370 domain-containing protein [Firmicutes bacterium]|nr:DUF370 domain-containing protein [Candidatus Colimorpha enterica]